MLVTKTIYPFGPNSLLNDISLGAAAPALGEVSVAAANVVGLKLTTGDAVHWLLDSLGDLGEFDLGKGLMAECAYESGKTGLTTGVSFKLDVKGVKASVAGEALSDASSSPDASITWTGLGAAAPGALVISPRKQIPNGTKLAYDRAIGLVFTCVSDGDAAGDDLRLLFITLWGYRRKGDLK